MVCDKCRETVGNMALHVMLNHPEERPSSEGLLAWLGTPSLERAVERAQATRDALK